MKKIAKIIAVCNQKGGVGKTVTAVNLGIGLARQGKRVLLVDVDPQGSLTASLGYHQPDQLDKTLSTVLGKIVQQQPFDPAEYILHQDEGVDLLPANIDLAVLEMNLVGIMGRETVVRELLETVRNQYDYILLDCPAGIEQGFQNAIAGADRALVVTTPEVSAIRDADRIIGLLEANGFKQMDLIINRLRMDMVRRGDMMSAQDVVDILAIPLIGIIPDDESVVVATNQGEPLVGSSSPAGQAYANVVHRVEGKEVPYLNFDKGISFWTRVTGIFHRA